MNLNDYFNDMVREQAAETQEKLDNLGHALDDEDLSSVSFEIRPTYESTIMIFTISLTLVISDVGLFLKDFVKIFLGERPKPFAVVFAVLFFAAAVGFVIFGILRAKLRRFEVIGSELIVKKKAYHFSDITRAELGVLNQLRLYHAEKKLLSISLAEYENADKLAAWIERHNVPVERDMDKKAKQEKELKVIILIVTIAVSTAVSLVYFG